MNILKRPLNITRLHQCFGCEYIDIKKTMSKPEHLRAVYCNYGNKDNSILAVADYKRIRCKNISVRKHYAAKVETTSMPLL